MNARIAGAVCLCLVLFPVVGNGDVRGLANDLSAIRNQSEARAGGWREIKDAARPGGPPREGGREGGEDIDTALAISEIDPGDTYADTGYTGDNVDDYIDQGLCGGIGGGPDVVYSYTPSVDQEIEISLCDSDYDTFVHIYTTYSPDGEVSCNDDNCGLQSMIAHVHLTAGVTYYIIIDGFSSSSYGNYTLTIERHLPCFTECPPGGSEEGEPPCGDGYVDVYNGGCDGSGWLDISCATCGKSGTYMANGYPYRDTDWYDVVGSGERFYVDCTAEFPLQLILIYRTDCNALEYDVVTADPCEETGLSRVIPQGEHVWVWVGPSVFTGVPCGSRYTLRARGYNYLPGTGGACCLLDGSCAPQTDMFYCTDYLHGDWLGPCTSCEPNPCEPTPIETTTWGKVKANYRR